MEKYSGFIKLRNKFLLISGVLLLVFMVFCGYRAVPSAECGQFSGRHIVGYYPVWSWYSRNHLVNPETILYEKYTVINYAFFRPLPDGGIGSIDGLADANILLGPLSGGGARDVRRSLPHLASENGVKVLASVGGWNDSRNFPAIAADSARRRNFAEHCARLILTYGFDGIDIDWEYPGYQPHGGTPADRGNFTLLLRDVRNALDGLESQLGRRLLLSACFGASGERMSHVEWRAVLPLLDMVNLMTYDFHIPYTPESNHHSPLYPPAVGNSDSSVYGAFRKLTRDFGVPAQKINIGLAFYGKALSGCDRLYGPYDGYDLVTFPEDWGEPLYYNVAKRMGLFNYYWDASVKNPYLLGKNIDTFVTYDDADSIGHKAQFAVDNNAMGVLIWEITGDYIESHPGSGEIAGTPLVDAVIDVFSSAGDSDCFIAAAAFGGKYEREVMSLRLFRDNFLLTSAQGRMMAGIYYYLSPRIALMIGVSPGLERIARIHLFPFVTASEIMLKFIR